MARWKARSATGGSLQGIVDYDNNSSSWGIQQDIQPFLDQAKADRDAGDGKSHHRKLFTMPDVVAIEIRMKHGIDIFDATFLKDTDKKAKLFTIVQQEYPHLLSTEKSF